MSVADLTSAASVVLATREAARHTSHQVTTTAPPSWSVNGNPLRRSVTVFNNGAASLYVAVGPTWPGADRADVIPLGGSASYNSWGAVWLQSASGTLDVRITEEEYSS